MREMERKTSNDKSLSSREESKESKPHLNHEHKSLYEDEDRSKTAETKSHSDFKVSDLNAGTDSSDVYEEVVIHYMDDVYRSEVAVTNGNIHEVAAHVNRDEIRDLLSECTKEIKENNKHFPVKDNPTKKEEEPDCGTVDSISSQGGTQTRDSISSQGGTQTSEDHKADRPSKAPKKLVKEHSLESCPRSSRASRDQKEAKKLVPKTSHDTKKKASKTSGASGKKAKPLSDNKSKNMKIPSKPASESSAGDDDKLLEEVKEIDILDEPPNGAHSVGTDEETADMEENGFDEDKVDTLQKIEEMELRIEKLEEELREIASLEIALYSVVPEHGSSAHKIHTPARRISRLYIHACKHWNQDRRASIARSAVSGLVLIAKACGNDVSRLTFWWSNTVVLRGIISQAFGNSHHSSPNGWLVESNGNGKKSGGRPSTLKWRGIPGSKEGRTLGFTAIVDDWQETGTFTAALEKIESWIYSRIIESVWWQTLTPHMQSPVEDLYTEKSFGRLLGPALGDQQQGSFSVNLWKRAFLDAFQRLCPIRAGGHECGCLPVLARMVMEKCVARLDVAMFNAILRESANEIPTDPVSDPIIDSKVLPIPAGDLSFGSGAQLKNSIGNWSRWLTDLFGIDADDSPQEDHQINGVDDDSQDGDVVSKSFHLLIALSDLLMLPKDMLIDRSIRKEVCPSLGLPLIKRILCNFTPDEFCPDPVPGALLEALNAESIIERRLSDKELISGFPCNAAPVVYCPPLSAHVAEKVADAGEHPLLGRNASIVQRKGYTSDDELDELDSPFASIIDKIPADASAGNGRPKELCNRGVVVARYDLLREVWLA